MCGQFRLVGVGRGSAGRDKTRGLKGDLTSLRITDFFRVPEEHRLKLVLVLG